MKIQDMNRTDVEADVVEALLRGDRVVLVGETKPAAAEAFRTIADAFVDDAGDMIAGATIRKTSGRERVELRNGGRLEVLSVRNVDTAIRGMAADRIYTPADWSGHGGALLRIYEAATIQSAKPTVIRYAARVEA